MNLNLQPLGLMEDFLGQTHDDLLNSNIDKTDGPISILRPHTLLLLSTMLNPLKIIPADSGLPRDWRGLAELAGLTAENMSYLEAKGDPFQELLKILPTISDSRLITVKDLKAFLGILDRYDVVDDAQPLFESDIVFYHSRVSLLNSPSRSPAIINPVVDRDRLTYDDARNSDERTRYDAFLLYSEEDSAFAEEVVNKLEKECNLKLCLKERDLLPGVMFEHEAVGRLIEERCNRLLVIFSPSFLESEGNKFLVSFTQALALESRSRKIIPCMYKRCDLPMSVRYSFCLDYNRAGKLWNFWEKLRDSLTDGVGVPNGTTTTTTRSRAISTPPSLQSNGSSSLTGSLSWWDAKKQDEVDELHLPTSSFDNLSLSSQNPLLSSSLPKYSSKGSSKKWYKKMIGGKKKKGNDKQEKVLAD